MKSRSRPTSKIRRRNAPKVRSRRSSSVAGQEAEVARLSRELNEAREQQTATSEVLKIISSSPGELEQVFEAMLANAVRICEANFGVLFRFEDGAWRAAAMFGVPPAFAEFWKRGPQRPGPRTALGRIAETRQTVHIADVTTEDAYGGGEPVFVAAVKLGRFRTFLNVPMVKEKELLGAFAIYRQEVRPFTDKQIELLSNFAAQAVIAVENTRLLNELRQSLEYQTAISGVLNIISRSPSDIQPVFEAIAETAQRLCQSEQVYILRLDEGRFRLATAKDAQATRVKYLSEHPIKPNRGSVVGRVALERRTIHLADVKSDPEYTLTMAGESRGYRTILGVPLFRDGVVIGVIILTRSFVQPYTDRQIELVTTFADQAVIAIENARLFQAERQRTRELSEALEQQTATAEVLSVISSSPGELSPVFESMLANATRLCEATYGNMWLCEGDDLRTAALHGPMPQAFVEQWRSGTLFRPGSELPAARAAKSRKPVQVADLSASQAYLDGEPLAVAGVKVAGIRTLVAVPMLKEDRPLGVLVIYRKEVRPFTDKQVDLLTNFAAQAVIAIENVRLLNELRQSLQQQTATADVLKVISRSTFDLKTVLQTLVESAAQLCGADKGTITRQKEGIFYRAEAYGFSREFMEYVKDIPIKPERGSASGRALLDGQVVHIADVQADPEYTMLEAQRLGDFRTILCVPMLREGVPIGVLVLTRSEVRPFSDKQIELVSTFADQAAIAIENVRLFESVEARTRELANSLENLRAAQDRLVQTEKLASLGQLTAGIAHEIKNPLNFVNNFSAVSVELIDELQEALGGVNIDNRTRSGITELTDMLRGNLEKVMQHGKRADSIVKNMLLHSREGSGEHRPVDINAVVEESLNLAYHGARAEKPGFNITLERSFDPAAGEVDLFPQEITRVLLNLISNGFYAATKRKGQPGRDGYEPILAAATKNLGDKVEISIRDNGTGIPTEVKERMFNPFFTTKPAGEGTGLGLSISYDIIVKQHAGSIVVDTQPGEFTEFRIVLPRAAASLAKSGERT